jgi:hypothetical protein
MKPKIVDISSFLSNLPDPSVTDKRSDSGRAAPAASPGKLIDRVLASLASGPKSLKEMIQSGEQFSDLLAAIQQLEALGYVEHREGDKFGLTESGNQANTAAS